MGPRLDQWHYRRFQVGLKAPMALAMMFRRVCSATICCAGAMLSLCGCWALPCCLCAYCAVCYEFAMEEAYGI